MALIDHINNFIRRTFPALVTPRTTSEELQLRERNETLSLFTTGKSRRERIQDARHMYQTDPRIRETINTLAADATRGGFTIAVTDGGPQIAQAQAIADELLERIDLAAKAEEWLKLSLKEGDSFLELSVDAEFLVQRITRKPTLLMHRNSNDFDAFDDPRLAYWFSDAPFPRPTTDAVWFADWQMVHARWNHDEGGRYGDPLYDAARKSFKRAEQGELDIAIRRKTRSSMRFLHFVDTDDPNEIEVYKQRNQAALNNKSAALADFFTNQKGAITPVQGDANLAQIEDVVHHIETMGVVSPLPLELLGYGRNLNRDILEEKRSQYQDALPSISEWVSKQIVLPIIERQWLLSGVWPGGLKYSVKWANKQRLTAKMIQEASLAVKSLQAIGLPDQVVLDILAQLIPGLEREELTIISKVEPRMEASTTPISDRRNYAYQTGRDQQNGVAQRQDNGAE